MVNDINIFFRLRVPIIKKKTSRFFIRGRGSTMVVKLSIPTMYIHQFKIKVKRYVGTYLLASSSETDTTVRVRVSVDA